MASGTGGSGTGGSGTGGAGTGGSGEGGTGTGGSGEGGAAPSFPYCLHTCAAPADCASAGAVNDADNYACKNGECEWLGCNSTAECVQAFNSQSYGCGVLPGLSIPSCYHTCASPADCASPSALYGVDNYACTGGLCQWLGCNTTDECAQAYMNPAYACGAVKGIPYNTCYHTCSSVSDCVLPGPLYGADNYECNGGQCEWLGCNSTAECTEAFMSPSYVCD